MRVKICGITRIEDAMEAIKNGVNALGFIFYKKSKRYVEPQKVKEIIEKIPPFVTTVGVFVNEEIEEIKRIVKITKLDLVQLHGEEDEEYIDKIKKEVKVLKAFRVKNKNVLEEIKAMNLDSFLLDAFTKEEYGGTGKTFDWEIARESKKLGNVILAGGINENNIEEIIKKIQPYAVDISSGVEVEPGIKDVKKIKNILKKINIK